MSEVSDERWQIREVFLSSGLALAVTDAAGTPIAFMAIANDEDALAKAQRLAASPRLRTALLAMLEHHDCPAQICPTRAEAWQAVMDADGEDYGEH